MRYFQKTYLEILFSFIGLGTMIFFAVQWAAFNDVFMIKNVEINGVQYFDDSSLASYKNDIKGNHIMFFDLKSYKNKIESVAYVKDCKISRTFPESINIVMLDADGICLPVEEYGTISLPILSNFKTNEELYPSGEKTKSSNVIKSIDVIKYSKRNFNRLYEDISEFVFNDSNEYEIILKNGKTKILLGSNNILKKIDYLKAFDNALPADKDFNIYKYIDLRYKDQIVVRERRV